MKNRILFISLAVVLALSIGLVGCGGPSGPAGSTKIVIGMSRSITGAFAVIHSSAFGAIYPVYTTRVNNAGGITVAGTPFPMDYLALNDNSEEQKLIANALALTSKVAAGTVHTIFGPTSTRFIDVMAPYINNADCVLMTVEGGASFLKAPGYLAEWPYVFIDLSFSEWYQLPVLAKMLADEGATKAYVFWQDDAHGLEYLAASATYFPANGITIVGNTSVLDGTSNYAALIGALNLTSPYPDAVCCFCYPGEVMGLTGTAIGMGVNANAWCTGPCANFGWFGPTWGAAAEGVTCFAVANNKTVVSGATMTMAALYNLIGPLAAQDFWGHPLYWAALEMWQASVAAVGTVTDGKFLIDQDDLRNYLANNKFNTVLGQTWYLGSNDGGTAWTTWPVPAGSGALMNYKCHTGEIGQWQSGYVEVVGYTGITTDLPNYKVTANYTYPKPNWPG